MSKKIKLVFKHKATGQVAYAHLDASGDAEQDKKAVDNLIQVFEKDGVWEHVPSN